MFVVVILFSDFKNFDFKGPKSKFEIFKNRGFFLFFQANFFGRYKWPIKSKLYASKPEFNQGLISGVVNLSFCPF